MDKTDREAVASALREAIETGEVLTIKYAGGSQPGSTRQISPMAIEGEDVRARCIATDSVKVFRISKIALDDSAAVTFRPVAGAAEPMSLTEAVEPHRAEIEALGWALIVTGDSAGIYGRFKNGKLRKSPHAHITFYPMRHDHLDVDDKGDLVEHMRPSERPWYVSAKHVGRASAFAHLAPAVHRFLQYSREASPASA